MQVVVLYAHGQLQIGCGHLVCWTARVRLDQAPPRPTAMWGRCCVEVVVTALRVYGQPSIPRHLIMRVLVSFAESMTVQHDCMCIHPLQWLTVQCSTGIDGHYIVQTLQGTNCTSFSAVTERKSSPKSHIWSSCATSSTHWGLCPRRRCMPSEALVHRIPMISGKVILPHSWLCTSMGKLCALKRFHCSFDLFTRP